MPDETATEATRSDAPGVDDSPFGDVADAMPTPVADEQDSKGETKQGPEGVDHVGEAAEEPEGSDDTAKAAQEPEEPDDADKPAEEPEGLKVVVSIKGSRATIGVQQPSSDPHIESFDDLDETGLTQEVAAVIERARARWEESPKHPAYERPAPPARRRNRRGQETAQATNAETETEQAQQQTLRLF